MNLTVQDWQLRSTIYSHWLDKGVPPNIEDLALIIDTTPQAIQASLERLNSAHQLFLDPQTRHLRMANPLSAIPTDYRVKVGQHWLYANCAWDTLGIAAMVGQDVTIEATLPLSKEAVTYQVQSDKLIADDNLIVHFSLPIKQWYDDLIHT